MPWTYVDRGNAAAAHSQDRLYYLIKWLGTPGDQSWEAEVRGH